MYKLAYFSGSRAGLKGHLLVEEGEPTDAEQEELKADGRMDYEVHSGLALCGKRNVGWKVLVIVEKLADPPQCWVCKHCLKRLKKE
jgi:hypothetical protein